MPYADPERQREYQRRWKAERRAKWIRENGPCIDCGTWEKLEIDHADASTKTSHRIWSWSKVRREAELVKCVVRCDPCHQVKSLAQDNPSYTNGFKHGTRSMYQKHRCRCVECRAWQSARLARQRNRAPVAQSVRAPSS